MNLESSKKSLFLFISGLVVSWFLGILGAPFFYALRLHLRSFSFWLIFLVSQFWIFYFPGDKFLIGFNLFSNIFIGGLFAELRLLKKDYMQASYLCLLISFLLSTVLLASHLFFHYEVSSFSDLVTIYNSASDHLKQIFSSLITQQSGLNPDSLIKLILQYIPFHLVLLITCQISFILYFEKTIYSYLKKDFVFSESFKDCRLPSYFMWASLLSLGAYLAFQYFTGSSSIYSILVLNLVMIFFVFYFFQGFAIIYCIYDHFKLSKLVRFIANFIILIYVFPLVSVLGFVDYWTDVRKKMQKKGSV